jgi:cobyrinic acid a,c-diamide synthase
VDKKRVRYIVKAICISAIASNQGKTILTTALLSYFKNSVRAFKIGPDFIDPQFHQKITNTPSINLDTFMMDKKQVRWMFSNYADKDIAIVEGVMGFYDGLDKGCSAYDVSKLLKIPTILLLDGSGSYITISAVLKGLKSYKKDNTIKAVILNKLSSKMHYMLIKNQIEKDFDDVVVLGWIEKNLEILNATHLGLDLKDMKKIEKISQAVLTHVDMEKLEKVASYDREKVNSYPFEKIPKSSKTLGIVTDKNFSFIYHDNIAFLKEVFKKVYFIDSTKDEPIPNTCDMLYMCGGYVESKEAYKRVKNSKQFKNSLIKHAKTKPIYAECASLLYLSKAVDDKKMAGVLDISFTLKDKRQRLGYYQNKKGIKGHAFHYTTPINPPVGVDKLSKKPEDIGVDCAWQKDRVYGTYLHTFFRNNIPIIKEYFEL